MTAAASMTPRINGNMVKDAAVEILGVDKHVAKNFGKAMETAFGHCKAKQRCMTSGAKLTASVKRVIAALAYPSPSPERGHATMQRAVSKASSSSSLTLPTKEEVLWPCKPTGCTLTEGEVMAQYGLKHRPHDWSEGDGVEVVEDDAVEEIPEDEDEVEDIPEDEVEPIESDYWLSHRKQASNAHEMLLLRSVSVCRQPPLKEAHARSCLGLLYERVQTGIEDT